MNGEGYIIGSYNSKTKSFMKAGSSGETPDNPEAYTNGIEVLLNITIIIRHIIYQHLMIITYLINLKKI